MTKQNPPHDIIEPIKKFISWITFNDENKISAFKNEIVLENKENSQSKYRRPEILKKTSNNPFTESCEITLAEVKKTFPNCAVAQIYNKKVQIEKSRKENCENCTPPGEEDRLARIAAIKNFRLYGIDPKLTRTTTFPSRVGTHMTVYWIIYSDNSGNFLKIELKTKTENGEDTGFLHRAYVHYYRFTVRVKVLWGWISAPSIVRSALVANIWTTRIDMSNKEADSAAQKKIRKQINIVKGRNKFRPLIK